MGNQRKGKTEPTPDAEADGKFSLISDEKLQALYKYLLKCRKSERRAGTSNGTLRAARNREAAIVAAAIDLGPGDVVCSRDHGWLSGFSDGVAIDKLLLASAPDRLPGAARRMGPVAKGASAAPITQTAMGTALAFKTRKNGKVAVVFSEDDGPEALRETVEIASTHGLPMVFLQQLDGKPNGHGSSQSTGLRKPKKPSPDGTPCFPSITVDSHDVVAVYRVASEALSRARQGRGPTLIECRPFRLEGAPTVAGSNRKGRHAHDAIVKMEHYLRARGLFHPKLKASALAEL